MDTRVFNPSVIFSVMPDLLSYLSVTLLVAVSSIVLGSLLGMGLTWAKLGRIRVLRWLAHGYTYILKCTPPIVLLFIVFYGLPKLIESMTDYDINDTNRALLQSLPLPFCSEPIFRKSFGRLIKPCPKDSMKPESASA